MNLAAYGMNVQRGPSVVWGEEEYHAWRRHQTDDSGSARFALAEQEELVGDAAGWVAESKTELEVYALTGAFGESSWDAHGRDAGHIPCAAEAQVAHAFEAEEIARIGSLDRSGPAVVHGVDGVEEPGRQQLAAPTSLPGPAFELQPPQDSTPCD